MDLTIIPLLALKDNYIWLLRQQESTDVIIVDPGEAEPVIQFLTQHQLKLVAILITHHHWDHTNGIEGILNYWDVPVFAPKIEMPGVTNPVIDGMKLQWDQLSLSFEVLAIPGHTKGHVAYFGNGLLFSGDTLFTAGCGRVFEGTVEQIYNSLSRLAALPNDTQIYCGHEYTQNNLRFAQAVEPGNADILQRIEKTNQLRASHRPTVPAFLSLEKQTNPFLRCNVPAVIAAAENHCQRRLSNPVEVFAVLRRWKNEF